MGLNVIKPFVDGDQYYIIFILYNHPIFFFFFIYRNFRNLTASRPVQFSCLDIDSGSDFVAAGSQDMFEIYLWSIKIGRLVAVRFDTNSIINHNLDLLTYSWALQLFVGLGLTDNPPPYRPIQIFKIHINYIKYD